MDSAAPLRGAMNGLACVACKSRKTRCDRAKPTCDGCFARRQPCIYPERKARKKATTGRHNPPDGILSDLIERVLQVEKKCSWLVTDSPTGESSTSPTFSSRDGPTSRPITPSTTSTWTTDTGTVPEDRDMFCAADGPADAPSADARLEQAIYHVAHLKRNSVDRQTAAVESRVPSELPKQCLDNFYNHYMPDIFLDFVNTKLMYLIPDIIDMSEVRIEPAALSLYYGMVYHGSLSLHPDTTPQITNLTQVMYVQCLRVMPSWKKQRSGTKTDLVVAILLMRAAFQQCDLDLSWSMYNIVCHCVKTLDIHNLDLDFSSHFLDSKSPTEGTDQERKGFWTLVSVELFFRLLHDKPAVITAKTAEWHVNLPLMIFSPKQPDQAVPGLAFLVKSRLTFLLLRFFDIRSQLTEEGNSAANRIQGLCEEIEALFQEWPVVDSMAANENNAGFWWMLYDLTLTAYCSMMIMSRELVVLQLGLSDDSSAASEASDISPLPINIARRILDLACLCLGNYPTPAAVCYLFGAFRCHVAYGCMAKHLFLSDPGEPDSIAGADIALLGQVAQKIATIAERDPELMPLVTTLYEVNQSIRAKWEEARGMISGLALKRTGHEGSIMASAKMLDSHIESGHH